MSLVGPELICMLLAGLFQIVSDSAALLQQAQVPSVVWASGSVSVDIKYDEHGNPEDVARPLSGPARGG